MTSPWFSGNIREIITRGFGFSILDSGTRWIPTHGFTSYEEDEDDDDGRDPTGVSQGGGVGGEYPFLQCVSDDLDLLISDAYLNYANPNCDHGKHFKIDWLCGFGTDAAVGTPPAGACATHPYDVQISDDEDDVVFNSTEATTFSAYPWGTKYKVLEWTNADDEILRIVIFTSWDPDITALTWPEYFEPTSSHLDPRVYQAIPPRVRTISVVTDKDDPTADIILPQGTGVTFQGGYNVDLIPSEITGNDGERFIQPLTINANPGAGIGQYPCETEEVLRRINDTTADSAGNVIMDAAGCYRLERPLDTEADTDLELGFPSAAVTPGTLKISNDCGPCCDCQDFINVYEAIRKLSNKYSELGERAEAVRDQYRFNKERWLEDKQCRKGTSLQLLMIPLPRCRVAVAAAICNSTDLPLHNVELRICFESTIPGCILCNTTTRRGNNSPTGKPSAYQTHPYKLSGQWPRYSAYFDCINPGENGVVHFMMFFPGCTDGDRVCIVLRAYGEDTGGAITITECVSLNPNGEVSCCDDTDPTDHDGDTDVLCDTDPVDGL